MFNGDKCSDVREGQRPWARLPWAVTAALCLLMADKVRTDELTLKSDSTKDTGDLDTDFN